MNVSKIEMNVLSDKMFSRLNYIPLNYIPFDQNYSPKTMAKICTSSAKIRITLILLVDKQQNLSSTNPIEASRLGATDHFKTKHTWKSYLLC